MFHLDNPSGVPAMPPLQAVHSATKLWFTEGGNGQAPSWPGADWFNIVSAELLYLLEKAGITPQKGTLTQLAAAIEALSVKSTRDLLIGIPLPWPSMTPPAGAMFLTGQALTQATDPKLYGYYGANIIDARAEILRGLDMGRGVDAGRVLLSAQGDDFKLHSHIAQVAINPAGDTASFGNLALDPFAVKSVTGTTTIAQNTTRILSSGGAETRMRNIALPYMTYRG